MIYCLYMVVEEGMVVEVTGPRNTRNHTSTHHTSSHHTVHIVSLLTVSSHILS